MKNIYLLLSAMLTLSAAYAAPMGPYEVWQGISDPILMDANFKHNFKALPIEGRVEKDGKFWSGDYWGLKWGNINYRWNDTVQEGFLLISPSMEQAHSMSIEELAKLAPSEKYDLYVGRYDYPLKKEVALIGNPKAKDWEGICHGWAPASMNHKEPTAKVKMNPDGIQIPFGSSDIKGLLSYYYAYGFIVPDTHQLGKRCDSGSFLNFNDDCNQDMNAGAFHIVIGNRIGLQKIGLVADIDRFKEVWNHPLFAYKTTIVNPHMKKSHGAAPGTAYQMLVKTELYYVDESDENTWEPLIGTPAQLEKKKDLEYELDLDENDNILGGKWKSKDRPDFLWLKERPTHFDGNLEHLGELLND